MRTRNGNVKEDTFYLAISETTGNLVGARVKEEISACGSGFTAMATATGKGELLRYFDAESGECEVELKRYAKTHPFGRDSDSYNIGAFRTKRYNALPFVVLSPSCRHRGTSAGVLRDVLKLAEYRGVSQLWGGSCRWSMLSGKFKVAFRVRRIETSKKIMFGQDLKSSIFVLSLELFTDYL